MSTIPPDEEQLRNTLKADPSDWESRKRLARLLYDEGSFQKAADIIWATDELPSIDLELAFAARVLAKAAPRKAIRLLTAVLEHNRGKAVQNLGLANALLHHGMVLQAARFYGAALEEDPSLGNPEFEHFILWTDDEATMWGNFRVNRSKLGDLPWMMRDPKEAMELTSKVNLHTTPIKLPTLREAPGEHLKNTLYQQKAGKGAQPSPPPAVTIPLDRVDPKHRLFDPDLGAPAEPELPGLELATSNRPEPGPADSPAADALPPLNPPDGGKKQLNKVNMPAPTSRQTPPSEAP